MGELLERELSRVLHNLPGEASPEPTLYADINRRARQIRRRRFGSVALVAAAAVAITAAVPTLLLGGGTHAAPPQTPAGPSKPITAWPARGALVHDASLKQAAEAAWNRGLAAAHRDSLIEPTRMLYADRVPNVGLVVILTGVEPRGGDRTVIVTGLTAARLSLYVDDANAPFGMLTVLFGTASGESTEPRTRCSPDTSVPAQSRTLFVLTDPAATSARWQSELQQPAYNCRNLKNGPWHAVPVADGIGSIGVQQRPGEDITVEVDGPGRSGFGSSVRFPGPLPVWQLRGGRVAGTVPIAGLDPVATSQSQTTQCSAGVCVSQAHGELRARASFASGPANPWGWGERKDASDGFELFDAVQGRHPEDGEGGQQVSVIGLALPDGTPLEGSFIRNGSGPTRFYLAASPGDSADFYVDHVVDNRYDPRELSAVVRGRDGNRWLFVAGEPGVASIDYRAHGSSHWRSMDVYESTGYLLLPKSDKGTGTIRLRTTNGTTVYQGTVDALHAI